MYVYIGYHWGDYSDAICMSTSESKVQKRLNKLFKNNNCYIKKVLLDDNNIIEFDND